MYIGPWQEYNLSKVKTTIDHDQDELKESVQRALLSSLDAASAAKAMEIFSANFIPQPQSDRTFHRKRNNDQVSRYQKKPLKLPSLNTDSSKNNIHSREINNPNSVRSSLSEPIRGNQISAPASPFISARASPSNVSGSVQPEYNAMSMINLLRLERATRQKLARADFGQFWDWKQDNNGKSDTSNTESGKSKKPNMETVAEKRVAQIKQMQKLYTSIGTKFTDDSENENDDLNSNNSAPQPLPSESDQDVTPSNTTYVREIATPVVTDRELTEKDFLIVSKYFNSPINKRVSNDYKLQISSSHPNSTSYDTLQFQEHPQRIPSSTAFSATHSTASITPNKPYPASPNNSFPSRNKLLSPNGGGGSRQSSASRKTRAFTNNLVLPPVLPMIPSIPNPNPIATGLSDKGRADSPMIDPIANNADGLLKWCLELDVDAIDSL